MEENLDKNNGVNREISYNTTKFDSEELKEISDNTTKSDSEELKEISDNTTKSDSEELKEPKSEKVINKDINNVDCATKVVIKNEINSPEKPITKPKKIWLNQLLNQKIKKKLIMERSQQKKQFCLQDSIQQTLRPWKIWIYQ